MIFLDESGKRWQRIKFGTGLLSSTAVIPVTAIVAAALLYVPSWGGVELPRPFSTSQPQVKAAQSPQHPAAHQTSGQASNNASQQTPGPGPSASSATPFVSSTIIGTAPSPNSTDPTTQSTTTTTTPPQASSGLSNQPSQTGNSDFGHTHQPTGS